MLIFDVHFDMNVNMYLWKKEGNHHGKYNIKNSRVSHFAA